MIRRIVLENYMSHANTVIEPAEGLTVLVGPNNCGKSAVVSALLTVCGENDGGFMVRHGEKLAKVTIETAEGDTIVWQRKRGTPSYVLNGREVHRVGRGNLPDDLQTLLKLPAIEFGEKGNKTRFMVHFGLQKQPVFLIDSESDVARFFSSSAEAERLLGMQNRHKAKTRNARGEQQAVEADLKHASEQLESLAPLEAIVEEVAAVEAGYAEVNASVRAADDLANRIARIESAGAAVVAERARLDASAGLRPAPAMDDPLPLDRLVDRFARAVESATAAHARQSAAHELRQPPALGDEAALGQIVERMRVSSAAIDATEARLAATSALAEPPVEDDTSTITNLGKSLAKLERNFNYLMTQLAVYDSLLDAPAQSDPAPLAQAVDRIAAAGKGVADRERAATTVSRQYEDVRSRIVEWVTQNPLCPVCGSPTRRETVLDSGGTHAA